MKRTITIEFDLDTEGRREILNRVSEQLNAYYEQDQQERKQERLRQRIQDSPTGERNQQIADEYEAGGISRAELGRKYNLSTERIKQITDRQQYLKAKGLI